MRVDRCLPTDRARQRLTSRVYLLAFHLGLCRPVYKRQIRFDRNGCWEEFLARSLCSFRATVLWWIVLSFGASSCLLAGELLGPQANRVASSALFESGCDVDPLNGVDGIRRPGNHGERRFAILAAEFARWRPNRCWDYRLDGSTQLDVIHDFQTLGLDPTSGVEREFITADIPVGGSASRPNRTALSVNQTFLEANVTASTPLGGLTGYARANLARSITKTDFQVYIAYAKLGWWKFGRDYTLALNQSAYPDTLDFETSNVIPWLRYNQLSVTVPGEALGASPFASWVLGIEDAEVDLTLPSSVISVRASGSNPSFVTKLVYRRDRTHLELAAMYRRLDAEGVDYESRVDSWGFWLSGRVPTWQQDSAVFGIVAGQALGAYADDTQGLGLDAAPTNAIDPSLRAIPAHGFWIAYQRWWNKSTRSTASYGYWKLEDGFAPTPNPVGTFQSSQYVSANLIWSPITDIDLGVEWLYGTRSVTANTAVNGGRDGFNNRLQATIRWNFGCRRR